MGARALASPPLLVYPVSAGFRRGLPAPSLFDARLASHVPQTREQKF
jgi:hypothetical protein